MPDYITAAERAAIAAFPPERVQYIPRGVSGIPIDSTGETWSRQIGAAFARARSNANAKHRRRVVDVGNPQDETDEKIIAWVAAGKTQADMAMHLGLTRAAVTHRINRMRGKALRVAKRDPRSIRDLAEEVRPQLERMAEAGMSLREIGDELGMSREAARDRLNALGLLTKAKQAREAKAQARKVAA